MKNFGTLEYVLDKYSGTWTWKITGVRAIMMVANLIPKLWYGDGPNEVIVPDDENELIKAIGEAEELADVIITTGGTGISPRDITTSALKKIAEKEIKGFGEAMRIFGVRYTPKALLSNCSGFVLNNGKIVIALPGSPLAVRDYIHLLGGLIKHALDMAKGKGHENNN